jgi:hypothetical protein
MTSGYWVVGRILEKQLYSIHHCFVKDFLLKVFWNEGSCC